MPCSIATPPSQIIESASSARFGLILTRPMTACIGLSFQSVRTFRDCSSSWATSRRAPLRDDRQPVTWRAQNRRSGVTLGRRYTVGRGPVFLRLLSPFLVLCSLAPIAVICDIERLVGRLSGSCGGVLHALVRRRDAERLRALSLVGPRPRHRARGDSLLSPQCGVVAQGRPGISAHWVAGI